MIEPAVIDLASSAAIGTQNKLPLCQPNCFATTLLYDGALYASDPDGRRVYQSVRPTGNATDRGSSRSTFRHGLTKG